VLVTIQVALSTAQPVVPALAVAQTPVVPVVRQTQTQQHAFAPLYALVAQAHSDPVLARQRLDVNHRKRLHQPLENEYLAQQYRLDDGYRTTPAVLQHLHDMKAPMPFRSKLPGASTNTRLMLLV
jgi:hypothetical protein